MACTKTTVMKIVLRKFLFGLLCFPAFSLSAQEPDPDFEADVREGCNPLIVQFTDLTEVDEEPVTDYSWDFGDGEFSSEQNPTHTYETTGDFNVKLTVTSSSGSYTRTRNGYIKVGNTPVPSLGPDTSFCVFDPLRLDAGNQGPGVDYLWENGSSGRMRNVLTSGTYSVIVDDHGCKGYDTINVTAIILISADFTWTQTGTCSPVVLKFTETSATCAGTIDSWSWDFGDGTPVSEVQSPSHTYAEVGTYSVKLTVRNSGGGTTTKTKSVEVTGSNTPVPSLDPEESVCESESITLNAGNPGSDYVWSTGETTRTIEVETAGNYSVVVDRGGCISRDTVKVTVVPELTSDYSFERVSGCFPVNYKFTDNSVTCSGGIESWSWDFGDGSPVSSQKNPTHEFTKRGEFSVKLTVTNDNGTTQTKSKKVTIDPPNLSVNLGRDTVICFNQSILLDAGTPGLTYAWNTGQTGQTITVTDAGTYSVRISKEGCSDRDTIKVLSTNSVVASFGYQMGEACLPVNVNFTDSTILSCGNTITKWEWDFGDGYNSNDKNPSHNYLETGNFTVKLKVTTSLGDVSSLSRKLVVKNTVHTVDLPEELTVCSNGSQELDAGISGGTYSWTPTTGLSDPTAMNPILTPVGTGYYQVEVTKCQVTSRDSVFIDLDTLPSPKLKKDGNNLSVVGGGSGASYQWFREGAIPNGNGPNIIVDRQGYYSVQVVSRTGCIIQSDSVFYIPLSGLEDPDDRIIFKVSPNPTRDVITLLISEALPDEVLVNVYNSEGKKMLSTFVKDNINRIPISRLSRGMYFVEIRLSPKRRKILSVIVN